MSKTNYDDKLAEAKIRLDAGKITQDEYEEFCELIEEKIAEDKDAEEISEEDSQDEEDEKYSRESNIEAGEYGTPEVSQANHQTGKIRPLTPKARKLLPKAVLALKRDGFVDYQIKVLFRISEHALQRVYKQIEFEKEQEEFRKWKEAKKNGKLQ